MSEPLSWPTIRGLDATRLNLAIEAAIFQRRWQIVLHMTTGQAHQPRAMEVHDPQGIWIEADEDPLSVEKGWGIGKCPYDHAACWETTMALSRHYGVYTVPGSDVGRPGTWTVYAWDYPESLAVTTDEEERLARCRLALWKAINGPHVRP